MNIDNFIFKDNIVIVPGVCKLELIYDMCIVNKILLPFNESDKFFKIIDYICNYYNIQICFINDDPDYIYNGVKITTSFYYLKYWNKNKFNKHGFCLYDKNQEYNIYSKDLIYSVGEDLLENQKKIYNFYSDKLMLDFILTVKQFKHVKDIKLINTFNIKFKELYHDNELLQNASLFFKLNNILKFAYIKLY